MSIEKIEADYAQLETITQQFSQQSDMVSSMIQSVTGCMGNLQGGGWEGDGALAFFAEMEDEVLPAVNRLQAALDEASQVTRLIHDTLSQAETDASACFNNNIF